MSLTESCLALAIASTVMAVAAPPLLRSKDVYVLNAAARDVATKLYAARIYAITRSRDCRLRVAAPAAYVVECEGVAGAWEVIDQISLRGGITITANARPEFHRRGNVSPTATISVWIRTGRMRQVVVNVNGRIRIP